MHRSSVGSEGMQRLDLWIYQKVASGYCLKAFCTPLLCIQSWHFAEAHNICRSKRNRWLPAKCCLFMLMFSCSAAKSLTNCAKWQALVHSVALSSVYKHMLSICVTYHPADVYRNSHISWSCHLFWTWSSIALSFSILKLLLQVVGTGVLQWMGTARERMSDTYVSEHQHLSGLYVLLPIVPVVSCYPSVSTPALCEGNFTCKENEVCVRPNECRCRHGYFGASCDTSKGLFL